MSEQHLREWLEPAECAHYRIVRYPWGVAIYAPRGVPLEDLADIADMRPGLDYLDSGIASALGASFVYTNERGSLEWRSEIDAALRERYDDELDRCWYGADMGISSRTIVHVLDGRHMPMRGGRRMQPDIPHDPADLGRCIRLLDRAPDEWRDRLDEVAERYPEWGPLVEHWGELEAEYRRELEEHGDRAPDTYELMRKLTEVEGE